jgi:hypothetical protein
MPAAKPSPQPRLSGHADDAPAFALARLVSDYLARSGFSRRQAAELAGLPTSTIDAVTRRGGRYVGREVRGGLERLGLSHELVEYAAAISAGFDLTPSELSEREWRLVVAARGLSPRVADEVLDFLEGISAATRATHPTTPDVAPA